MLSQSSIQDIELMISPMTPRRFIAIIVSLLTMVGFIAIIISALDQIVCEGQLINNNVSPTKDQQILGERFIGQSFVAPFNGLNRIDILFQTYQRQNTHDVTLRLLEISANLDNPLHGVELFQTSFNAANLSDQSWQAFSFGPLPNSKGKTYLIALSSPESGDGNAITVGGIERDVYEPGSAFLGATPVLADLTFRACFQMSVVEKLSHLSEQMVQSRPSIWGNVLWNWLMLSLYLFVVGGLFWQLYWVSIDKR